MKVDGKVQSLLLADSQEFEKVFLCLCLDNKPLYIMYFNNLFSPGKLFVLFSAMLLVFTCILKTFFFLNVNFYAFINFCFF